MPTRAGEMSNVAQPNAQWLACDGKPWYALDPKQVTRVPVPGTPSVGSRQDYIRRVGWTGRRRGLGPQGWIFHTPMDKTGTWKVATCDNNVETTLTNPPTVAKPPAGVT